MTGEGGSVLRAWLRLLAFGVGSFVLLTIYVSLRALTPLTRREVQATKWTRRWAVYCRRVMGIRVRVSGPSPPPGALLTPNHITYADVMAVGGTVPCFFVAKADVARWPFIGRLFRAPGHIVVTRNRAKDLLWAVEEAARRLESGNMVCVFVESTSSPGDRLLPFKSSFYQSALDAGAPVVPVGIRWTSRDPRVDPAEDIAYWRDGHVFLPHALHLAGFRGAEAELMFGDPLDPSGMTRHELTRAAQQAVEQMTGLPVKPDNKTP
jgi:1-acyl-sn-glycerol-3-phosphate acyltransferase